MTNKLYNNKQNNLILQQQGNPEEEVEERESDNNKQISSEFTQFGQLYEFTFSSQLRIMKKSRHTQEGALLYLFLTHINNNNDIVISVNNNNNNNMKGSGP